MSMLPASGRILDDLRLRARDLDKPQVRLASLERLAAACDAVAGGGAAEIHKKAFGVDGGLRVNPKINPSNIEKYVKARAKLGDKDWTGPTRVFISADPDLRAYVAAREDERIKPAELARRPSQRQKDLEDAIGRLPTVEMRQIVRHDLAEGRVAKKRLDLLTRGLRSMPAVNVDLLLSGGDTREAGRIQQLSSALPGGAVLPASDVQLLRDLLRRLTDAGEMARAGLEFVRGRVKLATAPGTTIVRPDEMSVLRRLAGPEPGP